MNKETWNILGAVVLIAILSLLVSVTGCEEEPVDAPVDKIDEKLVSLEVGQVWECETENPFDTHVLRKIVALESGYVKYERIDGEFGGSGIGSSMSEEYFRSVADKYTEADEYVEFSLQVAKEIVAVEVPEMEEESGSEIIWLPVDPNIIELDFVTPVENTTPAISKPPVWGNGELPDEFQQFFGTSNSARLDYVQNQAINKHGLIIVEIAKRLLALEVTDPNGLVERRAG